MRYQSTRGGEETGLVDAVMRGLAGDGGLFVPEELPRFAPSDFRGETLAEIASELLAPFFADSGLEGELRAICAEALDFPLPLKPIIAEGGQLSVLELFHGPTAAFKDVGARFLAALMERALVRQADGVDPPCRRHRCRLEQRLVIGEEPPPAGELADVHCKVGKIRRGDRRAA